MVRGNVYIHTVLFLKSLFDGQLFWLVPSLDATTRVDHSSSSIFVIQYSRLFFTFYCYFSTSRKQVGTCFHKQRLFIFSLTDNIIFVGFAFVRCVFISIDHMVNGRLS